MTRCESCRRPFPLLALAVASCLAAAAACGGGAKAQSDDLDWSVELMDVPGYETTADDPGPEFDYPFEAWPEDASCGPEDPHRCGTMTSVQKCAFGHWVLDSVCIDGDICLAGVCVPHVSCDPGTVNGCFAFDAAAKCDPSGLGYVPEPCPEGTRCVLNGECRTVVCTPGFGICADDKRYQTCKDDGSGYDDPRECHEGLMCIGGQCRNMCESEVKISSYLGCEYWSVDLHNMDLKGMAISPRADLIKHAIVVGNPGTSAVWVTFETQDPKVTIEIPQADKLVPAGEMRTYTMPVMSQDASGINKKSVRVTATHPITAYQFNPLNNVGVASNDGSLLLPVNALGKEYIAISFPGSYMPEMPEFGFKEDDRPGYVTIVAVTEGDTQVTISRAGSPIAAGDGVPAILAGKGESFNLKQYEVLNLETAHAEGLSAAVFDVTGTIIEASKPVAAFGGMECAVLTDEAFTSCCCCDHVEEQLIPLHAWGKEYHAVKFNPRGGTQDADWWLVMAGEDGVQIQTDPPIPGVNGLKLDKGRYKRFYAPGAFEVTGTGPIAVAQYMLSQGCTYAGNGDPSMLIVPAVYQYRKDYTILVPDKYAEDWVTLVRPANIGITLDGSPVKETFTPFGSGKYEYAYVPVVDGVRHFESAQAFAVLAYGFDAAVSYAYAGGMNVLSNKPGGQ
ncbi:MAG: IgGFc-binding protein [Deltaproteobacteria bacterium]|nr:IgGFc-binding protein [Deltaproteobacteria bacterium]